MSHPAKLLRAKPGLRALIGYALLTLLMTLPVATRLTTRLVGWGNDPYVHYWNNWWVGQALKRRLSPYYTDMLFHPNGASMIYHNFAWLNIAGALALRPLAGPVGAYNIVFLANIALCGYSMYSLADYVLEDRGAAFIAGLVHAFWPYRMHHVAHPNLISTQWMVWFLLFLVKTVREGKRRHVLLAALFLTLTAFARLQLFVLALFPAALYLLYGFLTHRERWSWQTVGRLALIGALTGAALAYPFWPLLRDQLVGVHPQDMFVEEQTYDQSDLLAYVMPNPPHPLRRFYAPEILRTQVVFVGYTTLALALYGSIAGLRARQRSVEPWLLIAGFSFVMALGPSLRFHGGVYPRIPLPYRLLGWSFPVRIMRSPHRFNILLAVPVALLVGFGIRGLAKRSRRAHWLPAMAVGLVLFEYLRTPLPTLSLEHSPLYNRLAGASERFAVYDLPMGFSGPAKFYMYLQTIHEKPIVQGKMSRPARDINTFIDGDVLTRHLRLTGKTIAPDLTAVSEHLGYLADADVRYLILHRDTQLEGALPNEDQWSAWQSWLTMKPLYEDERIALYPTRPRYGRDFDFEVDWGEDVGIAEVGPIEEPLAQGDTLELELRWGSRATPERDWMVRLSLIDQEGSPHHSMVVHPCADWPTGDWPSGAIAIGRYRFPLDPHLPPGPHTVTAELLGAGRPVALAHPDIQSLPRSFVAPESMGHTLDLQFGSTFALLGYDLTQEQDTLKLTLHWQATQRPEKSYKVFVHLFDPVTDSIVAQNDAVPRGWTYPTTWWEAGEVVSDEIRLSTDDIPQGRYTLNIGMYRRDSGERLNVVDDNGLVQAQSQLVLQEVTLE
ncbi:MAG: hypothetical protein PVF54_00960 [Anaerolineae bacterium]|jgi:hypothetical protein